MIVLGWGLIIVGGFLALVSTAGFDEAKKDGQGLYALPIAVLVVGGALFVWGVTIVKSSWG